ncbi:ARGOS-like protein [Raphanus sativus]|uniref:ARGOS-like protein n=1 Tax=Raphanus sativus TaxID=3726 RepID=A0A6J0JN57_RAPSA|nr:ARGOS-like protein [Raphanus sativus]
MSREISSLQSDMVNIQHQYSSTNINNKKNMDTRRDNQNDRSSRGSAQAPMMSNQEHFGTLSSSQSSRPRKLITASYFSLESVLVLVGLTASLLILPLILPPLPPPPFMLLLIPIGIMVLLMVLALMPSSSSLMPNM